MAKRNLTARQVRYLFATGRLRASGKGKDRKVTYSREGGKTRAQRIAEGRAKADAFVARHRRIEAGLKQRDSFLQRVRADRTFAPGGNYLSMQTRSKAGAAGALLGRTVNPRSKKDVNRAVRQVETARDLDRRGMGLNEYRTRNQVDRVNRGLALGAARRSDPALKARAVRLAGARRQLRAFEASPRGRQLSDLAQAQFSAGIAADRYMRTLNAFGNNNAARADKRAFESARKQADAAVKKAKVSPQKLKGILRYFGKQ